MENAWAGPPGPHTRAELEKLVSPDDLAEIEVGDLRWYIKRQSAFGVSGTLEVAQREAEEKARAKPFVLSVIKPDGSLRSRLVDHEPGARLVRAIEFDAAAERRGSAASELFAEGKPDDWTGIESEPTWDRYQWEFERAAEALVKLGTNVPVLAFLFLCRQQLELMLKGIIVRGRELLGLRASLPKTHSLQELWALAYPIMKATWVQDAQEWPQEWADQTKRAVAEFHVLDPGSDYFRYPVDTQGRPVKHGAQLANFSPAQTWQNFETVTEFLEASRKWIEMQIYFADAEENGQ